MGNIKEKIQLLYNAVGRTVLGIAMVLSCILGAGCGKADKALSIPLGETLAGSGIEADSGIGAAAGDTRLGPGLLESGKAQSAQDQTSQSVIYVHVCGAVRNPGVVELPEGSRGEAALEAAGGFAEDAAEEAVNLAQVLADGMKLYFPTREENAAAKAQEQAESAGLVNINTAGTEALCTLPGIGEAKARAIVAYREQNGAFASAEEIMQVPGIKGNAYNKIRDLIIAE